MNFFALGGATPWSRLFMVERVEEGTFGVELPA